MKKTVDGPRRTKKELDDELLGMMKPSEADRRVVAGESAMDEVPPWSAAMMDSVVPGDVDEGAMLFYKLTMGQVSVEYVQTKIQHAARVRMQCRPARPVRFVIWIRHHWVLGEYLQDDFFRVYDSAKSLLVTEDLSRLAVLLGLPIPQFPMVPQQETGSEECGVFVFAFMRMLQQEGSIPKSNEKVSLRQVVEVRQEGVEAMASRALDILRAVKPVEVTAGEPRIGDQLKIKWRHVDDTQQHVDVAVCTKTVPGRHPGIVFKLEKRARLRKLTGQQEWTYPMKMRRDFLVESVDVVTAAEVEQLMAVQRAVGSEETEKRRIAKPKQARKEQQQSEGEGQHSNYGPLATVAPAAVPDASEDQILPLQAFMGWQIRTYDAAQRVTPPLVWGAVTEDVRKGHLRELKALQDWIRKQMEVKEKSLDALISLFLGDVQKTRRVCWATVERVATNLIGALAYARYYAVGPAAASYTVSKWCGFKHSLTTIKRKAAKNARPGPVPATFEDVKKAHAELNNKGSRVFLILAWFSAQRPGDLSQLRTENVKELEEMGQQSGKRDRRMKDGFNLRFVEGKVASRLGRPFHVPCKIPDKMMLKEVREYIAETTTEYLFPGATLAIRKVREDRVREALRMSRPELEWKSMRRGTLQTLATVLNTSELLKFSHHKTESTLLRYLGDGAIPEGIARSAVDKSEVLGGSKPIEDPTMVTSWLEVNKQGDIQFGAPAKPRVQIDRSAFPVHLKKSAETVISIEEGRALAEKFPTRREAKQWLQVIRYLFDPSLYNRIPYDDRVPMSALRQDHTQQMLKMKNIGRVKDKSREVKNVIKRFLIAEDDKKRFRLISHPIIINEVVKTVLEEGVTLEEINKTNALRRDAWEDVEAYGGALELDFESYFERFELGKRVQPYFCFPTYDGWFKNLRMPTGAIFSSAVGTATTRLLLCGVENSSVAIRHQIDNVRFAGPKEEVIKSAMKFVLNCKRMNACINGINWNDEEELRRQLEEKYSKRNDFMGDVADFETKEICGREKQVERLKIWRQRASSGEGTYREFFSAYCSALHISEVLGIPGTAYMRTRMFFRACARELAGNPLLWDKKVKRICPMSDFDAFMVKCIENKPGTIKKLEVPESVVFVDACRHGWGYVQVKKGNVIKTEGRTWTEDEKEKIDVESSVSTEPTALRL